MALPTLENTWQFSVNNVETAGGTALASYQKAMFRLKAILVGFASNAWTVVASSNGTVANTSDNWTSAASIVFASSGARSWIVLKQTGIASNFQILISCFGSTTGQQIVFKVSPSAGFTGLTSVSADPTATDSYDGSTQGTGIQWMGTHAAPFQTVVHGQMSSDGARTRVAFCVGAACRGFLMIDKLANPATGMTNPTNTLWVQTTSSGSAPVATTLFAVSPVARGSDGGTVMSYNFTTEGYGSTTIVQTFTTVANQISSEWPLTGIGSASATATKTGRHGRISDAWAGSAAGTIVDGSTYPADSSRQFIQFGQLVLPWNGTVPQLT